MVIRWRVLRVALYDAWPVWVAIVVVLAAGLLGRLLSTSLTGALRYAGTALEVAGLCTVAVGLYHTRKLFGQPTVTRRISSWLSNLAHAFRRPEATTFNVEAGGYAMVGGKARLRVGAGPNTSVERRLEILERNVDQLEQEMDTEIREVKTSIDRLAKDLPKEREERRQADEEIARQIEGLAVGGLHLEAVGLFWLTLGLLAANLPDEIARLMSLVRR